MSKPGNDLSPLGAKITAYYLGAGFLCWVGGLGIVPLVAAGTAAFLVNRGFAGFEKPRQRRR